MAAFLDTVARHRRTLACFPRARDRACYIYGRILRRVSWPLPGRQSAVQVRLRGQCYPFHLRLSSTDWLVLEEIFLKAEYTFVQDCISDARSIVDLGANVGFSLRYWQTLFPKARMVAMEPEPDNCEMCLRNLQSAGMQRQVTLLHAAAGAQRREIRLVDVGEGEWAYRTEGSGSQVGPSVEVLPLAEVLQTHMAGQAIDLLKCDIEGAERELFEHCGAWINRVNAIAIELHPPYGPSNLLAVLKGAGANFEIAAQMDRKLCPVMLLRRPRPVR